MREIRGTAKKVFLGLPFGIDQTTKQVSTRHKISRAAARNSLNRLVQAGLCDAHPKLSNRAVCVYVSKQRTLNKAQQ